MVRRWVWFLLHVVLAQAVFTAAITTKDQRQAMRNRVLANAESTSPCIADPTLEDCAGFVYSDSSATADVENLCSQMPFMTACSVWSACKISQSPASVSKDDQSCAPFQLLGTICVHDSMGGMRDCKNYTSMCRQGSVVQQCKALPGMQHLVTTAEANDQVKSICYEMDMDGCEKCKPSWDAGRKWGNCSLLDVYGALCFDMPDMRQCGSMKDMCARDGSLYPCCGLLPATRRWGPTCGSGAPTAPVMKMYFFTDMPFYLLFKDWTPSTPGQYAGAWFAVFFLAVVFEALQTFRYVMEARLLTAGAVKAPKDEEEACPEPGSREAWQAWARQHRLTKEHLFTDACRALLQLVVVAVAYTLMLAVMSFNVGIFFAAVVGIGLGSFVFGRFKHYMVLNPDACCGV